MECQNAAKDLTEKLNDFLSIKERLSLLDKKSETRRAVGRMLEVIATIADCIAKQKEGIIGAFSIVLLERKPYLS